MIKVKKLGEYLTDQNLMNCIKERQAEAEAITKELMTLFSIISRDLEKLGINISILNDLASEKEKRNKNKK